GERRPALRHLAKTNNVCQFKSKLFQQKREAAALGRYRLAAELQALRHAADYCPHEAGAGPSHALQHPPPVRIYIAFFGHSSLLVAIGVWVMSAISARAADPARARGIVAQGRADRVYDSFKILCRDAEREYRCPSRDVLCGRELPWSPS